MTTRDELRAAIIDAFGDEVFDIEAALDEIFDE